VPLTDTKIRNLKARSKSYKIADYDGLFLAIQPSGSKLWRFKYRSLGKEKLLSIGPYPSISLAQARKVRDAARADLQAKVDPSEAKQVHKRMAVESATTLTKLGGPLDRPEYELAEWQENNYSSWNSIVCECLKPNATDIFR